MSRNAPVPPEALGIYACATSKVTYWAGPKAGTSETLQPGEYEFHVNTATGLSSSYEFAETIAPAVEVSVLYRPGGLPQLVARQGDELFTVRIAIDEVPMRFTGLGPYSVLSGICYFEPQASR